MSTRGKRQHGNGGKARQRKDGRWTADVSYRDETGAMKRTSVYGANEAEVEEKRAEVLERIRVGLPATDSKVSLDVFARQWIAGPLEVSDRKPTTKQLYAGLAKSHIIGSTLGATALGSITPSGIERWVAGLKKAGLAQSTVRQIYTVLRAILAIAVRDKLIRDNPAAAMARPKVETEEAMHLSPGQVADLLAAADGSRYRLLFEFLLNTAMRRGEALALTWKDIDEANGLIRVRGTLARLDGELKVIAPKTRKGRREIPISTTTAAILKALKVRAAADKLRAGTKWAGTSYVFVTELGEAVEPRNALRALKAAVTKHNKTAEVEDRLPDIGLHTLRHTAASAMLTAGVPMLTVSRICGHQSIEITADIYGHVAPDTSLAALETLSRAITVKDYGQKQIEPGSDLSETGSD
ncbi:site-specific integrase [Ammonicoccus fulvus]|uniref:Site-specific integrase n=1 Tax=Ammonicoccus fulvus TaxID=3138240 RepID=A0ABZ3FQI0_9ACTN